MWYRRARRMREGDESRKEEDGNRKEQEREKILTKTRTNGRNNLQLHKRVPKPNSQDDGLG
jgi:hypothetical protein